MNTELPTRTGPYGLEVVLDRPWGDAVSRFVRERQATGLHIGAYTDYQPQDLSFLRETPELCLLNLNTSSVSDDSVIASLTHLRSLSLQTSSNAALNLSELTSLEDLSLRWRETVSGLGECTNLRCLSIENFEPPTGDLAPLRSLIHLRKLEIVGGSIRKLSGLQYLSSLRFLDLSELRLDDPNGISDAAHLRGLAMSRCGGVETLGFVSHLTDLVWLTLLEMGQIESLRPLAGLTSIEVVGVGEGTVIRDGDMSVLTRLPNLKRVMLVDQPHYSHRSRDFPKHYSKTYEWLWQEDH